MRSFIKEFAPADSNVNLNAIIKQGIHNAGLWRGPRTWDIRPIAKCSILCFICTNITQIIAMLMAKDDLKKLFAYFSILSFCLMGLLKLWSLVWNQKRWRFIVTQASYLEKDQLNNDGSPYDYESDNEEENHFSEHINLYTKHFSSISTYLGRIYSFTAVVFIVSPFIEYGIYVYQEKDIDEFPHILPGWAPLDVNIFGYLLSIFAETVAAIYCVKIHIAFDLIAVGLMIFIRGQFCSLHAYSERIGGKGDKCDLWYKRDIRAHYRIKQCHYIHVTLLKSVDELTKLIQNILGIYFFVATFTLCSVAIQFKLEYLSNAQLMSLLLFMCASLTQLFLFCHFGDAVFNESAVSLGKGPFCSAIWCLSPKIRREIAILCVGMSRPCRMRAGPFHSLDLPSFIQIIRTAYSYYAVLHQTTQ